MKDSRMLRRHRLFWVIALMTIVMLLMAPLSASAATTGKRPAHNTLHKGALPQHGPPSKPLQQPKNMPDVKKTTAKPKANVDPIDVKTLVIAADGNEADLPGIKQTLDYLGEPYTIYLAAQTPGGLTPDKLTDPANSVHAFYQAVILTTDSLGYNNNGVWTSALSQDEWTTLANFEVAFGIRQVTWYTYPNPDYGFNYPTSAVDTSTTPYSASFTTTGTTTGKTVFGSYANITTPLKIQYAYTYLATPLDADTQVLLKDAAGNALGAIRSYKDSTGAVIRQNLALTFDSNQYLTHNLILSYGLVNWVTKGLFLGQRHTYLLAQPDDMMIDDSIWQATTACSTPIDDPSLPTFRMSGNDLTAFINWQKAKQTQATTGPLTIEWPFNGVGTTAAWIAENGNPPGQYSPDTLTPAIKTNQGQFNWISHTYDHENLDSISYANATTELQKNDQVATQLSLNYTKKAMVTPDISGLSNPAFLAAAYNFGVRDVVGDTSRWANPSPNAGITLAGSYKNPAGKVINYSILEIPRHPVNLYYDVTTPQQWLAQDNCLYPSGANGHVDTYQQLLDRESSVLLSYLLQGDMDPLMFHQPNAFAYDGTHSILGDLLDATFTKYNALFKLTIKSPTEQALGQSMADRMTYNTAGVTAKIVPTTPTAAGSITVTATTAATVPVTGVAKGTCTVCTTETYGGQPITSVKLTAGQSVTLALA